MEIYTQKEATSFFSFSIINVHYRTRNYSPFYGNGIIISISWRTVVNGMFKQNSKSPLIKTIYVTFTKISPNSKQ